MPSSMFDLRLPISPSFPFSHLSLCIPNSNLVFDGKFAFKNFVLNRNRSLGPCRMTELVETSAFGYRVGDEEARMIQPESFSYGLSRFDLLKGQFESKLNELSKWLVSGLFCLVILLRHDPESLWAAMGSVVNSAISVVLKSILNQERPIATLRSDPGMPSSHAQSISFIAVFVILSISRNISKRALEDLGALTLIGLTIEANWFYNLSISYTVVKWLGMNAFALTLSGVTVVLASYLTWLRVSQQLHTISQVGVGAVLGSGFSLFWFWFWKAIVSEAYIYSFWVRVVVFLGASAFCLGFIVYVIKNWFRTER